MLNLLKQFLHDSDYDVDDFDDYNDDVADEFDSILYLNEGYYTNKQNAVSFVMKQFK